MSKFLLKSLKHKQHARSQRDLGFSPSLSC